LYFHNKNTIFKVVLCPSLLDIKYHNQRTTDKTQAGCQHCGRWLILVHAKLAIENACPLKFSL